VKALTLFDNAQGWYLSRGIWKIWEKEMLRTLASPLYVREWQKIKGEFADYRKFADYVSKSQENGKSGPKPLVAKKLTSR
jgi:hypothetical protein